jgi:hypothetical protein
MHCMATFLTMEHLYPESWHLGNLRFGVEGFVGQQPRTVCMLWSILVFIYTWSASMLLVHGHAKETRLLLQRWPAIQKLFAEAMSDTLILLDTSAAASATTRPQSGSMEVIMASGFKAWVLQPGEHFFHQHLVRRPSKLDQLAVILRLMFTR